MKKLGIFVDVQNIYYTTRQVYGRQFNYRELWARLSKEGNILCANAYATSRGDDKQQKFQKAHRRLRVVHLRRHPRHAQPPGGAYRRAGSLAGSRWAAGARRALRYTARSPRSPR